jgi:hypothetical protein
MKKENMMRPTCKTSPLPSIALLLLLCLQSAVYAVTWNAEYRFAADSGTVSRQGTIELPSEISCHPADRNDTLAIPVREVAGFSLSGGNVTVVVLIDGSRVAVKDTDIRIDPAFIPDGRAVSDLQAVILLGPSAEPLQPKEPKTRASDHRPATTSAAPPSRGLFGVEPFYSYENRSTESFSEDVQGDPEIESYDAADSSHLLGVSAIWYYESSSGPLPLRFRLGYYPASYIGFSYARSSLDGLYKRSTSDPDSLYLGESEWIKQSYRAKDEAITDFYSLNWRHTFHVFFIEINPTLTATSFSEKYTGTYWATNRVWNYVFSDWWTGKYTFKEGPAFSVNLSAGWYIPHGMIQTEVSLTPYHNTVSKDTWNEYWTIAGSGTTNLDTTERNTTNTYSSSFIGFSWRQIIPINTEKALFLAPGCSISFGQGTREAATYTTNDTKDITKTKTFTIDTGLRFSFHRAWSLVSGYDFSYVSTENDFNGRDTAETFSHTWNVLTVEFAYGEGLIASAGYTRTTEDLSRIFPTGKDHRVQTTDHIDASLRAIF